MPWIEVMTSAYAALKRVYTIITAGFLFDSTAFAAENLTAQRDTAMLYRESIITTLGALLAALVGAVVGGLLTAWASRRAIKYAAHEETLASLQALETELRLTAEMIGVWGSSMQAGIQHMEYTVPWVMLKLPSLENAHRYIPGVPLFVFRMLSDARAKVGVYNARAALNNSLHARGESHDLALDKYAEQVRLSLLQAADYMSCFLNNRLTREKRVRWSHAKHAIQVKEVDSHTLMVCIRLPGLPCERRKIFEDIHADAKFEIKDDDLRLLFSAKLGECQLEGDDSVYRLVGITVSDRNYYLFDVTRGISPKHYPGPIYTRRQLDILSWSVHLLLETEGGGRFVDASTT